MKRGEKVPRVLKWSMCLWPGFSAAWVSGSFRGLVLALLFIVFFQAAWIGTFVWPACLTTWETYLLWWSLGGSVLGSVLYQALYVAWLGESNAAKCSEIVLQKAQALYLQGNYFEAEELLIPYVSHGEWDVEAGLWLASIYRRTCRLEAASVVLQTLESLERSGIWSAEIRLEHRKITESRRNKRLESL
jgi:hypothetical protein